MTIFQLKFYLRTCWVLVLTVDVVVCPAKAMNLQNHLVLFFFVGKEGKILYVVLILNFISFIGKTKVPTHPCTG